MLKRLFGAVFGGNQQQQQVPGYDAYQQTLSTSSVEKGNQTKDQHSRDKVARKRKRVTFADQKRRSSSSKQVVAVLNEEAPELIVSSDSNQDEQENPERNADSLHNDSSEAEISHQDEVDSQSFEDEDENEEEEDEEEYDEGNSDEDEEVQSDNSDEGSIFDKRTQKRDGKANKRLTQLLGQKKNDTKHAKKLLEEASVGMRNLKRSLDSSFQGMEELNCPICMDYIISCRTAICGHSFCEACITESLIHRKECPNCRKDIRKWVLSKSDIIDSSVKLMTRSKGEEEVTRYQDRLKTYNDWYDKQDLKVVKPGDKVDALDTEYIWCKAQVELKIRASDRKPLLYLHYDGWSRKYDEYIYMDSRRVAPMGIFTSRQDIPRYQSNGASRQPMNYAQVIDSARNMQINQDQIGDEDQQQAESIDIINDPDQAAADAAAQEDNDGSIDSNAVREDLQNELEQAVAGASAVRTNSNPATSLNRDSNIGGRNNQDSTNNQNRRREQATTRSSQNRPSVFYTNPFLSRTSNNNLQPQNSTNATQRQSQGDSIILSRPLSRSRSQRDAAQAAVTSRPIFCATYPRNSPFLDRNSAAQNNSGDAGNSNNASGNTTNPPTTTNTFSFSRSPLVGGSISTRAAQRAATQSGAQENPEFSRSQREAPDTATATNNSIRPTAATAIQQQQRRVDASNNNTGNIMRGTNQSQIFGNTTSNTASSRPATQGGHSSIFCTSYNNRSTLPFDFSGSSQSRQSTAINMRRQFRSQLNNNNNTNGSSNNTQAQAQQEEDVAERTATQQQQTSTASNANQNNDSNQSSNNNAAATSGTGVRSNPFSPAPYCECPNRNQQQSRPFHFQSSAGPATNPATTSSQQPAQPNEDATLVETFQRSSIGTDQASAPVAILEEPPSVNEIVANQQASESNLVVSAPSGEPCNDEVAQSNNESADWNEQHTMMMLQEEELQLQEGVQNENNSQAMGGDAAVAISGGVQMVPQQTAEEAATDAAATALAATINSAIAGNDQQQNQDAPSINNHNADSK